MTVKDVVRMHFVNDATKIHIVTREKCITGVRRDKKIKENGSLVVRAFACNPGKNRCKVVVY